MKIKFLLFAALAAFMFASCEKPNPDNQDDPDVPGTPEDSTQTEAGISGEVSGVWEAGSTIHVSGHIVVPEGKSLTIEEGATVIFSNEGVGVNHVKIEFSVDGNLYCLGTEENPVLLTVAENLRSDANKFEALWGGIVAGATCEEMLIDHTIIEYCGGAVIECSPAAENGY